jgi:hypothetical protein
MKTYSVRDWMMISMSFAVAMIVSVTFSTYAFSFTERTKTLMVVK